MAWPMKGLLHSVFWLMLAIPKLSMHLEQNAPSSFEFICDFMLLMFHCIAFLRLQNSACSLRTIWNIINTQRKYQSRFHFQINF